MYECLYVFIDIQYYVYFVFCVLLGLRQYLLCFIQLPEATICCLLLYQKPLYVVYCFCLRFLCFVFVPWLSSYGYHFNHVHSWFHLQLMALPYLPKEHIRSSFNRLYLTVPVSARPLRRFMSYIKYTWITSSKFPVNIWSVFGQPVRTNNDIEGW
jgi:hypothetical protein